MIDEISKAKLLKKKEWKCAGTLMVAIAHQKIKKTVILVMNIHLRITFDLSKTLITIF